MKTRVFTVCAFIFLFCGIVNAGINDGLVAYYPFNGNANDESGNGNHGTVYGATLTTDRFGNINRSYSFNGKSDYIEVPDSLSLRGQDYLLSVSVWIKKNGDTQSIFTFIRKGISCSVPGWQIEINNNLAPDKLSFMAWDGKVDSWRITNISPLNNNEWAHVVGTSNGNTASLYVNGVIVGAKPVNHVLIGSTWPLTIGAAKQACGYAQAFYQGSIADIRIYNRALSEAEIQQLYQGQGACSSEVVKFTAGTPAKAADVNANFDAHNCQIQALKAAFCQEHPTASLCP